MPLGIAGVWKERWQQIRFAFVKQPSSFMMIWCWWSSYCIIIWWSAYCIIISWSVYCIIIWWSSYCVIIWWSSYERRRWEQMRFGLVFFSLNIKMIMMRMIMTRMIKCQAGLPAWVGGQVDESYRQKAGGSQGGGGHEGNHRHHHQHQHDHHQHQHDHHRHHHKMMIYLRHRLEMLRQAHISREDPSTSLNKCPLS